MDFFLGLGIASVLCVVTMFCLDTESKMYKGRRDDKEEDVASGLLDPLVAETDV